MIQCAQRLGFNIEARWPQRGHLSQLRCTISTPSMHGPVEESRRFYRPLPYLP